MDTEDLKEKRKKFIHLIQKKQLSIKISNKNILKVPDFFWKEGTYQKK